MKRRLIKFSAILLGLFCLALLIRIAASPWLPTGLIGAGRFMMADIPPGVMPAMDKSAPPRCQGLPTVSNSPVVLNWASWDLPDWFKAGKVSGPRICLAKLAARVDVKKVNDYLLGLKPWSTSGSHWGIPGFTGNKGDYDFSEVTLVAILHLFGNMPEVLYPETRKHILDVLLIENGNQPRMAAPNTFGIFADTENHHLMTEGARYLKHDWLFEHEERGNPAHDNTANGLESWMIAQLEEMRSEGIYEFNSIPYLSYTVQGLLNLQAFPRSDRVRALARDLLDRINLQYALGSLSYRRCVAFRRRTEFMDNPDRVPRIDNDPHTMIMRTWTGIMTDDTRSSLGALIAEVVPYTLPPVVAQWVAAKPQEYFVRIGRGTMASPELHSGGPGWLLSAGGVKRGMKSMIVARPTVLMLNDGAERYTDCFRIMGRGDYTRWNNTGVCRRFACGNSPVEGPPNCKADAEQRNWAVFVPRKPEGLKVAAYSDRDLGIIAVFPESKDSPKDLLARLIELNPDATTLRHRFEWPGGGTVEYDVEAPAGTWTITKTPENATVERDYDRWPQWDGDVPAYAFQRN